MPYSFGIAGSTWWYSVPTGAIHRYVGTTERMRIDRSENIDCGGGIAINGSHAIFNDVNVNSDCKTNTCSYLKFAGTNNDWCYLKTDWWR